MLDQAQSEMQLRVWKELAISKQVLMRSAAEALKLDPNCTQDELKDALDSALKKVKEADASVVEAREQAKQSVSTIERKLMLSQHAQASSEAAVAELRKAQENMTQQMAIERAAVAKELQKLKAGLAEKEKALKAINAALADTPENVVKKLKALKKEKQDEADARRLVEGNFNTLRKEKQQQDQKLTATLENTTKLVAKYRELHEATAKLHEQLKPLIADAKDVPALLELDTQLLEAIENPEASAKKAEANSRKQESNARK